jgi:hypothetical protein
LQSSPKKPQKTIKNKKPAKILKNHSKTFEKNTKKLQKAHKNPLKTCI